MPLVFAIAIGACIRYTLHGADRPDVIIAGPDWAPYDHPLDIVAGGVFDRSGFVFADAPAGKNGRIITTPDGHFAFEKQPARRARFWGVNLSFDSLYLDREKADLIADRLARAGYNTIRFSHFDQNVVKNRGHDGSHNIDLQKLDQLEYFFAALKKRGIYVTLDLYHSRHFPAREIPELGRSVQMEIKQLIPVSENAYNLWREFARKFLTHRNPYTGLTWAEDPALMSICMLNEESFFFGGLPKRKPDILALYEKAYAEWRARQPDPKPPALAASLHDPGRPAIATDDVTPLHQLPASVTAPRTTANNAEADAAFNRFLTELKIASDARMASFLRNDLGVRTLLSGDNNMNTEAQVYVRDHYDFVDNHEYWNHPVYADRSSTDAGIKVNPHSSIVSSLWLPRELTPSRIFGKPYTVSEYNYCFPNPARAEGGVLMPAWSALQDWDAIYNFDYSSRSRDNAAMFTPATTFGGGYVFALVTDPIGMIADRAAAFLFLHGGIKPAPEAIAYLASKQHAFDGPKGAPRKLPGDFSWLGLQTRTGTLPAERGDTTLADLARKLRIRAFVTLEPLASAASPLPSGRSIFTLEGGRLEQRLAAAGHLPVRADPDVFHTATGQLEVSRTAGTARLITERAECFIAPACATLAGDRVAVANGDTFAAIYVLAVDGRALSDSRRLLVLHLTDSLNTGMTFTDDRHERIESLGTLPHLIRRGEASISLKLSSPSTTTWQAWAVDATGRRQHNVQLKLSPDRTTLTLQARTVTPEGVTLAYELSRN